MFTNSAVNNVNLTLFLLKTQLLKRILCEGLQTFRTVKAVLDEPRQQAVGSGQRDDPLGRPV